MVQLKAGQWNEEFISEIWFQFLMVQLKETPKDAQTHFSNISIPYGSIKRCCSRCHRWSHSKFQFLMVQLKVCFCFLCRFTCSISIPYGSIKSYKRNRHRKNIYISIPYGSIKRFLRLKIYQQWILFQFLMVQLKGFFLSSFEIILFHFNSLWFN